jgi:predicted nucleotide-binding protein (sugar kinase/HSP70/actin superfamily)
MSRTNGRAAPKTRNGRAGLRVLDALTTKPVSSGRVPGDDDIDAVLGEFEQQERRRLGLAEEKERQWRDPNPQRFTRKQRATTTILFGGLTRAQDQLISGAVTGLGYKIEALDVPDDEALRVGKEFGNRGQCNPTYFTVGNLLRYLGRLRDEQGLSVQQIVDQYLFLTPGSCGPCRFGTYVTEYRKALRDAGFENFRVMLFQQQGGLRQATGTEPGLAFDPPFFIAMLRAIIAGDVLNLVGYRLRPYERDDGATDAAVGECKRILHQALRERTSVVRALLRCRRVLDAVEIDRLQPKPKVSVIGEFWAMTTEGDGNHRLQSFLESEGAEVDIQSVTTWVLYNIWEHRFDTRRRMSMRREDGEGQGLKGTNAQAKLATLWLAEQALRGWFALYARLIGLGRYSLPSMDEIAAISHEHYDNHLRGGEGHMEVGKLIQSVEKRKAHMVVSVKPFGCMPSSGVSDGVQSMITTRYPDAIFCAIETTGDGAVSVQSRVQMDLFKARRAAVGEYERALAQAGLTQGEAEAKLRGTRGARTLYYPRHASAGTAANHIAELMARARRRPPRSHVDVVDPVPIGQATETPHRSPTSDGSKR